MSSSPISTVRSPSGAPGARHGRLERDPLLRFRDARCEAQCDEPDGQRQPQLDGRERTARDRQLHAFSRSVTNVPIINSTNTTAFQTGILWDTADGGASYNGTQDVAFITKI